MDSIDTLASAGYDRSIQLFKGSASAADPPGIQEDTKIENIDAKVGKMAMCPFAAVYV